jgi:hypothetical protein
MKEEILIQTAKEYFAAGEDELKKERYNSAVVLFFKALAACIDTYLLQKLQKSPSSHTERFNLTKKHFPSVYEIIDKDFILSRQLRSAHDKRISGGN